MLSFSRILELDSSQPQRSFKKNHGPERLKALETIRNMVAPTSSPSSTSRRRANDMKHEFINYSIEDFDDEDDYQREARTKHVKVCINASFVVEGSDNQVVLFGDALPLAGPSVTDKTPTDSVIATSPAATSLAETILKALDTFNTIELAKLSQDMLIDINVDASFKIKGDRNIIEARPESTGNQSPTSSISREVNS